MQTHRHRHNEAKIDDITMFLISCTFNREWRIFGCNDADGLMGGKQQTEDADDDQRQVSILEPLDMRY